MEIHGYQWISMDVHGYPWISMDIHATGLLSYTMKGKTESHLYRIKGHTESHLYSNERLNRIAIYLFIYNPV